jgi:hypothetical protein
MRSVASVLSLPPGVTPDSFGANKNITFNEWPLDAGPLTLQPGERITVVFFAYLTMEWEPVGCKQLTARGRGVCLCACACVSGGAGSGV